MFSRNKTAESCNGVQGRDDHCFPGAASQQVRVLFLGETVENVNSVSDADSHDERKSHDVGGIERQIEQAHQASGPNAADSDRYEGKKNCAYFAEVNPNHDNNRAERIVRGLDVAVLQ